MRLFPARSLILVVLAVLTGSCVGGKDGAKSAPSAIRSADRPSSTPRMGGEYLVVRAPKDGSQSSHDYVVT